MFYTYVLKSIKNNKRYVGQTSKDVFERLREHNTGSNKWTRANRPFMVVHFERYSNKVEAIRRERFLKSGQGRKWLDEKFNIFRGSSMVERLPVK